MVEVCLPEEGDRVPNYIASNDHCGVGGEIEDFATFVFLAGEFWGYFASGLCKSKKKALITYLNRGTGYPTTGHIK